MKHDHPIGYIIHKLSAKIDSYIHASMSTTVPYLTRIESVTLGYIIKEGRPLTSKEIAEHFAVQKSTASQTIHSLLEKGMITMTEDEEDHRKKKVEATTLGVEVDLSRKELLASLDGEIEDCLLQEEREELLKLLDKIDSNIDARR